MGSFPDTIGPYRIEDRLGRGGMGEVYRAWDERLERQVALKIVRPESAESGTARERFRREARAAAGLSHSAIVRVYDILEWDGGDAIVMELVEGESLSRRLSRGPLPVSEAVHLGREIARGLAAAHARGIVHRDLKAENVMITAEGSAKILDFGLAKRVGTDLSLTGDDKVLGTFRSMSPEQARGLPLDPLSDLFSLGVLFYEMLSGRSPFAGDSAMETLTRICTHQQTPLQEVEPGVPEELSNLVDHLLEKDPARRPQSAREVARKLRLEGTAERSALEEEETWIGGASPGAPAGVAEPRASQSSFQPVRWRRALAAAGVALALGTGAWIARLARPEPLSVAVAPPEIVSGGGADAELLAFGLRGALLRGLLSLEGVSPLALEQVDLASGSPAEVARATAAGEVVTTRVACARETCQISLSRISAKDDRVLWTQSFSAPLDDPYLCNEAAEGHLRQGYEGFRGRRGSERLEVRPEDYKEYLRLHRELVAKTAGMSLDDLLDRLAAVKQSSPRFLEAYILEADLLRQRFARSREAGDLDRAIQTLARARELAPADPRPLVSLAEIALRGERLDLAEEAIVELQRIQPGDPSLLVQRARLLERRGEGEQALALMREAVDRRPSLYHLSRLVDMEFRLGESAAARRHLKDLLARFPDYYAGWSLLAQIELQYGNPQHAVEIYSKLIGRSLQVDELINLGTAYMLLGRYAKAEEAFRRVLSLEPDNPYGILSLADTCLLRSKRAEAERLYRRLISLIDGNPALKSWPMVSAKAQALAHLGERQQAAEAAHKVLFLASESPQAAQEAALIFALVGDQSSALFNARRALEQGVDPVWFQFPWFDPLRSSGEFRSLVAQAEKASEQR